MGVKLRVKQHFSQSGAWQPWGTKLTHKTCSWLRGYIFWLRTLLSSCSELKFHGNPVSSPILWLATEASRVVGCLNDLESGSLKKSGRSNTQKPTFVNSPATEGSLLVVVDLSGSHRSLLMKTAVRRKRCMYRGTNVVVTGDLVGSMIDSFVPTLIPARAGQQTDEGNL